mmetsp:Transcript_100536/g.284862  ORF Transcript_100536/g.284862 Transcript_100536/m.284862 type:complete len:250 (-) Transcript_100536:1032-1781(-)
MARNALVVVALADTDERVEEGPCIDQAPDPVVVEHEPVARRHLLQRLHCDRSAERGEVRDRRVLRVAYHHLVAPRLPVVLEVVCPCRREAEAFGSPVSKRMRCCFCKRRKRAICDQDLHNVGVCACQAARGDAADGPAVHADLREAAPPEELDDSVAVRGEGVGRGMALRATEAAVVEEEDVAALRQVEVEPVGLVGHGLVVRRVRVAPDNHRVRVVDLLQRDLLPGARAGGVGRLPAVVPRVPLGALA